MKKKLLSNMLLKVLSVFAAILLWLVVVNIDEAVQEKTIRNIKVNILNDTVLTDQDQIYWVEEGTDTVDVTVSARRSVLARLKASDFVATADMQKDLRYDSMIKIDVSYTGSDAVAITGQSRTNVLVSIEESVTEQFKVTVDTDGTPSDGLVVGSAVPERTIVEITGPVSVVERIKTVSAKVDITGITGTAKRTCMLQLLDSDGNAIDDTFLEYIGKDEAFSVTVTTLSTKEVGISFDISEAAPEGYGVSAIYYVPGTVVIAGEKSALSPIRNLQIPPEALNAEQLTGHVEETVNITSYLPDGIQIPDKADQEIVVTMEITPYETQTVSVASSLISFTNLPEGMEVDELEDETLEIPVVAFEGMFESFDAGTISLSADLSDCERTGRYTVPVTVTLPEGYSCNEEISVSLHVSRSETE